MPFDSSESSTSSLEVFAPFVIRQKAGTLHVRLPTDSSEVQCVNVGFIRLQCTRNIHTNNDLNKQRRSSNEPSERTTYPMLVMVSHPFVLTYYHHILSESVGISILVYGELREKKFWVAFKSCILLRLAAPWRTVTSSGGVERGGGISQVRPFNLHVRARSCRAITTGTLYQLHHSRTPPPPSAPTSHY